MISQAELDLKNLIQGSISEKVEWHLVLVYYPILITQCFILTNFTCKTADINGQPWVDHTLNIVYIWIEGILTADGPTLKAIIFLFLLKRRLSSGLKVNYSLKRRIKFWVLQNKISQTKTWQNLKGYK